jgi:hypothetical protein
MEGGRSRNMLGVFLFWSGGERFKVYISHSR